MKNWRKHILFDWVFFKSTLPISLVLGMATGGYRGIMSESYTMVLFINQCLLAIPFGLILDLLYKELAQKEQYYFYYNQGISKVELWIVSFFFSFSFYLLFKLVYLFI